MTLYQCAMCSEWVLVVEGEPTQTQLDAALDAYREMGRPECEADHVEAMREAVAAALAVRP